MNKQTLWFRFRYLFFFALIGLACGLPSLSAPTPTPQPEAPPGSLYYSVPSFSYNLEPGSVVPGTRLEYVAPFGDGHEVRIDGQRAARQINESFRWDGIISQGVFARYNLRLTSGLRLTGSQLAASGPVEIYILNPEPTALPTLDNLIPAHAYYFSNIPVGHGPIPPGGRIAGTTLVFEEITSQGVRLSGTDDYPYWGVGDTVYWSGRLRDNVFARFRMPITQVDERGVRLSGEAELWIIPPSYRPPPS
jgi:hypothetical protein